MRGYFAALALTFPLCASADLVHVEYDGVVNSVTRTAACGCDPTRDHAPDHPDFTAYSVGDRLHGFLTIDLAAAGPDLRPLEPAVGIYDAPSNSGGYISGNGAPLIDLVLRDSVSVRDTSDDYPFEHYQVTDQWSTPNGQGQLGVLVVTRRTDLDLVTGDGIAQTIDATPSSDLELVGYLSKFVQGVRGSIGVTIGLLFDRVTVTPGQCKAW